MKGAEQLARSCRRLGREGVGARRAGTRTRAARAPRSPPPAEGSRAAPAPPRPAAPRRLRGAQEAPCVSLCVRACAPLMAVSPLSLLGLCCDGAFRG